MRLAQFIDESGKRALAVTAAKRLGAGRGLDSLIFVKLSHNVGAGLVISGSLHRGASGFAGELAHIQVREDGTVCRCGGRGCLATLVGPSLEEFVRRAFPARCKRCGE